MNQFDLEQIEQPNQDCFFAKILRECSMDRELNEFDQQPRIDKFNIEEQARKSKEEQKLPVDEFMRWKGLEDSDQQVTYEPEPQLIRAQSLRLQQERKISNFIQVFGKNGVDPASGKMKTFSPQKHKKIMKARNEK